jgi:hypothetical protein
LRLKKLACCIVIAGLRSQDSRKSLHSWNRRTFTFWSYRGSHILWFHNSWSSLFHDSVSGLLEEKKKKKCLDFLKILIYGFLFIYSDCHPMNFLVRYDNYKKLDKHWLEIEELNHFGVIAGLFWRIGGHSSRFVLLYSFWRLFTKKWLKV